MMCGASLDIEQYPQEIINRHFKTLLGYHARKITEIIERSMRLEREKAKKSREYWERRKKKEEQEAKKNG
jgi:hypothetical protein